MKKTKFERRIENAIDAFFNENEREFENTQIVFNSNSTYLETEPHKAFAETSGTVIKMLRQVFLFLPGALCLYLLPIMFIYFSGQVGRKDNLLGLLFGLSAGSFLTLIGIGSLREKKNLAVPISIVSFSVILGILFSFFPEPLLGYVSTYYSIYLFPVALMIASLVKTLVNDK